MRQCYGAGHRAPQQPHCCNKLWASWQSQVGNAWKSLKWLYWNTEEVGSTLFDPEWEPVRTQHNWPGERGQDTYLCCDTTGEVVGCTNGGTGGGTGWEGFICSCELHGVEQAQVWGKGKRMSEQPGCQEDTNCLCRRGAGTGKRPHCREYILMF